jgi:effector-binding domain-containing protein
MKMTKEIEEFINLTITEHMGKSYADWKLSQSSVTESDEIEKAYKKVIETLPSEQEEIITKYCDAIFNSGAETEEFFYRLGLRDGLKLRKVIKSILKSFS